MRSPGHSLPRGGALAAAAGAAAAALVLAAAAGGARAAGAATAAAEPKPAVVRSGTYLVAAGRPGKIKEKFSVTRAGAVVTSVADAIHPAGRNLKVVTRTDAASGALLEITVELKAKTLPERKLHATVSAGHVHFTDSFHGTDAKLPLKTGALPLFIDPGGLLAHHLTILTERYDWSAGGEQIFWVYNPGFAELRVRVAAGGAGEGKLAGKAAATRWLKLESTELSTLRIEVGADDHQVLRVIGPKGEELARLDGFIAGPVPADGAPATAAPAPPPSLPKLPGPGAGLP